MEYDLTLTRTTEENELAISVENSLVKCEPAMQLWKKSHSNTTWNLMTVGGEYSPSRRLRQVCAELQKKQGALIEAQYNVRKKLLKAKRKREKANRFFVRGTKKELLLLEAEELEANAERVREPYLGALQDVQQLSKLHDTLVAQIGDLTRENIESHEAEYWCARAVRQSLRGVRQSGVIDSGNQELLEQLGIDPHILLALCKDFLIGETQKTLSSDKLDIFVTTIAKELKVLPMNRVDYLYGDNDEN